MPEGYLNKGNREWNDVLFDLPIMFAVLEVLLAELGGKCRFQGQAL